VNRYSKTLTVRELAQEYHRKHPLNALGVGESRVALGPVKLDSALLARNRARWTIEGKKRFSSIKADMADITITEGTC
jgi:hypothetical protein